MARPSYFYRNARAGDLLEMFLVAAITTLLLVRFLLHLTGYPSVGGRNLHIAHMLYGGLLMTAAVILLVSFIGSQVQRLAATLGGVGFGLFIDELGKFITRDNNYFFQPTVALIYVVFIGLFVLFRFLGRVRNLTSTEYLLNAIKLTEEVVINDLDEPERRRALWFLDQSDAKYPLVAPLRRTLQAAQVVPDDATFVQRWRKAVERIYERLVATRAALTVIDAVFVVKAAIALITIGLAVLRFAHHQFDQQLVYMAVLQLVSSLVAAILIIGGVVQIHRSRLLAYEYFSKSLLVDIFLTQFFAFYRTQFSALPVFIINILLYITVRFLQHQERRLQLRHSA